jgi:hypothetical protein
MARERSWDAETLPDSITSQSANRLPARWEPEGAAVMLQVFERHLWSSLVVSVLLCAGAFFASHRITLNGRPPETRSAAHAVAVDSGAALGHRG